ncbi:MAG: Hsp70 family protein [Spirochaetaceae bacterium]|nr:Hsp70 family protein [Spirochaetaceae bacterium]
MSRIGIGLDFGTSNTTAAIYDGTDIHYIKIDPFTETGTIMPTALYLDREFSPTVGSEALSRCLKDNTGRKIVMTDKEVGCVTVHMGEMDRDHFIERDRTFTTVVTGKIDSLLPGRLFRSMKSYLGDKGNPQFDVFGKKFRIEAILTVLLRYIHNQIRVVTGDLDIHLFIGRPVLYSGTGSDPNRVALERMRTTCTNGGISKVSFVMEPEAAAVSYLHSHTNHGSENILVFDFGGGTLDLCILKRQKEKYSVLSVSGIARAGDYIDKMIYRKKIFPLLGEGLHRDHDFHFSEFEDNLLNWQSTYLLNQAEYIEKINHLMKAGGEPEIMAVRLKKLIRGNASFLLMESIEQAKIELSSHDSTVIDVEEIDLHLEISREELEEIIEPLLGEISGVISLALARAELDSSQVDRILCTGGSSRIPMVKQHLAHIFGKESEQWDSFRGIAAGLAVAGFNHFQESKGQTDSES